MKSTARLAEDCYMSVVDNGRHHGLVLDLPGAKGGDDLGPTALELAVMALSGCISTIFAIVAKNSKVTYHKFICDVEADKPDSEPTIVSAKAKIYVESADGFDKVNRVLEKTMQACPVGQLYEKAGVHIETELEVKES